MILLLDNYDSFVHNLARYLRRLGQETTVVRSDEIDVPTIRRWQPAAIVISPGPRGPAEAGCSLEVVRELGSQIPILGVCLGHQVIGMACGARVVRASEPRHGRTSEVYHAGQGIFRGIPNPVTVCRYHSLVVDPTSLPACLRVTGQTAEGTVMGLEHTTWPMMGVQFHPEAVLTRCGYPMLANFLQAAGLTVPHPLPSVEDECRPETPAERLMSDNRPCTF